MGGQLRNTRMTRKGDLRQGGLAEGAGRFSGMGLAAKSAKITERDGGRCRSRDREGSGGILPPGKRRAAGSRPSRQTPSCFDPRPLRFSRFQMEICRMNRFGRLLEEKIRKNGQKSLKMSPKSGFQAILRLEARVPAGGVPEGRSSMIQIVSICVAVILCSRRDRACSDWDRKRSQQAAPLHRSNAQNGKNSPDGSGSRSNLD